MKKEQDKLTGKGLANAIDTFLAERRKSDGSYAEVTENDMKLLREIVNRLCAMKWEADIDGDLPVKVMIIDHTRYIFPLYRPVPGDLVDNFQQAFDVVHYNLNVAIEHFEFIWKYYQYRLAQGSDK